MPEAHDKQSRTEEATDKRLTDARHDGNVPMSREAPNFAYLLAALLVIAVLGQAFVTHIADLLISLLSNSGSVHLEGSGDAGALLNMVGREAAIVAAPIILTFGGAGVLAAVLPHVRPCWRRAPAWPLPSRCADPELEDQQVGDVRELPSTAITNSAHSMRNSALHRDVACRSMRRSAACRLLFRPLCCRGLRTRFVSNQLGLESFSL